MSAPPLRDWGRMPHVDLFIRPSLGYRVFSVAFPLAMAFGAVRYWDHRIALIAIAVAAAVGVGNAVLWSFSYVTMVDDTLRYRVPFRTVEVPLADVRYPARTFRGLAIPIAGRRRLFLYSRLWGRDSLDAAERRLNAIRR